MSLYSLLVLLQCRIVYKDHACLIIVKLLLNGLFVKNVTMICQPIVLFGFTIDNKDENVKNVAIILQAIVMLKFTIC